MDTSGNIIESHSANSLQDTLKESFKCEISYYQHFAKEQSDKAVNSPFSKQERDEFLTVSTSMMDEAIQLINEIKQHTA